MKLTIQGTKRYYEDEDLISDFSKAQKAIKDVSFLTLVTYNRLYEKKYNPELYRQLVPDDNITRYLKEVYGINDYYVTAVYSLASGELSSQTELHSQYKKDTVQKIKKIDRKILNTEEQMDKYRKIKQSLIQYSKTKEWIQPYPRCKLTVVGHMAIPYKKKPQNIDVYENYIDKQMKRTRTRIKNLKFRKKRTEEKLENFKTKPPKRIVKGSKALFKQKDTIGLTEKWREDFLSKRNKSAIISGRKISKHGNYLCTYNPKTKELRWRVPYTMEEIIFKDFEPYTYKEEYLSIFGENRRAVGYSFTNRIDGQGRRYITVSAIYDVSEDPHINCDYDHGAISIDLNVDHIAYAETDEEGQLIQSGVVKMNLNNKSHNQAKQIIGDTCARIAALCDKTGKPLIMENIDTSFSKSKMLYDNPIKNGVTSRFAYNQMTEHMRSQARKHKFEIRFIDPAYTSFFGKINFMRDYGLSIHCAAAYVIGLKGLEYKGYDTIPEAFKNCLKSKDSSSQTAELYRLIKPFNKHYFYREFPIFKNKTNCKKYFTDLKIQNCK